MLAIITAHDPGPDAPRAWATARRNVMHYLALTPVAERSDAGVRQWCTHTYRTKAPELIRAQLHDDTWRWVIYYAELTRPTRATLFPDMQLEERDTSAPLRNNGNECWFK
jgi:hypothetical protein